MDKKKFEKERRIKSLASSIKGEGFEIPKDLEERAEIYEKGRINLARHAGYHPQDISIYTNPFHYMKLVLEAMTRMPSTKEIPLIGKDELEKFLRESVERKELSLNDAGIITGKYIHYNRQLHGRSDRTIDGHSQVIKLFLNDRFAKLYEKFFGKRG